MLPTTATKRRPLPVAPRPFDEEVLGGWIGRVASRYKMSVVEFATTHGLELRIPDTGGWLLMQPLPAESVETLAELTRLSRRRIKSIAVPNLQVEEEQPFRYCARCAFVNPLDVMSPIWRREWLDPAVLACSIHAGMFRILPYRSAIACENLDQLFKLVSRREHLRTTREQRASKVRLAASAFK